MNFVVIEIFNLFWFSLTLGAFGKIKQRPNNKVFMDGETGKEIDCKGSANANLIKWGFTPVGSTAAEKTIKDGDSFTDDFGGYVEPDGKTYNLVIKTANSSTAGIYSCSDEAEKASMLLIVLTRDPTCDFSCVSTLQLSCDVSYIVDPGFVTPKLTWSTGEETEVFIGENSTPSTSGIITTTTSKLNVNWTTDGGALPIYTCKVEFTTDKSALVKCPTMNPQSPVYTHKCQPFASPDSVTCGGEEGGGKDDNKGTTDKVEKSEQNSSPRSAETNNLAILVLGVAGVLLLAQMF